MRFSSHYARQRRVDRHKTGHAVAVLRGEGVADHVADVVGDEGGSLDLERIENACNVAGLRFLVVAAGRLGGEPHAAQVGNDHRVIARQVFGKRNPHVASLAIAVPKNDPGSPAADAHIELSAVRRDLPRAERLGVSEGVCTRSPFHLPHRDV